MGAIGGGTAKRHRLWSNCVSILNEVSNRAGYLSRADMLKLPGDALVRKYVDGNGIARHAGIPGKLKKSQSFVGSCSDIWNGNILTAQTQTLNIGIGLITLRFCPRHYPLDFGFLVADLLMGAVTDSWMVCSNEMYPVEMEYKEIYMYIHCMPIFHYNIKKKPDIG